MVAPLGDGCDATGAGGCWLAVLALTRAVSPAALICCPLRNASLTALNSARSISPISYACLLCCSACKGSVIFYYFIFVYYYYYYY